MTKLREALRDKIAEFRGYLGHPDYNSEIEQNAVIVALKVLEELGQVVEYEPSPRCVIIGGGFPRGAAPQKSGDVLQIAAEELHGEKLFIDDLIERTKCLEYELYEHEERYTSRDGWHENHKNKDHGVRKTIRAKTARARESRGRVGLEIYSGLSRRAPR